MTFRVHVFEAWDDFPQRRVRLYVDEAFANGHRRVLLRDGSWYDVPDGANVPEDVEPQTVTFLPRQALEPLAEELERFLKGSTHKGTEAAVLREWLAVEIARVDRAMGERS